MNYKTVLVLMFVVLWNAGVFVLLWQLDVFVNVNLYNHGLIFSYDWAVGYWQNNLLCWAFLLEATAFTVLAMVPHFMLSRWVEPNRCWSFTSFAFSLCALVCEGLSIYFLNQVDLIVVYKLPFFGIPQTFSLGASYEPLMIPAYALMAISLAALFIPLARSLGIIEIDIVDEEE
jgi:hypothetical protein